MEGRRVEGVRGLERPGDYAPVYNDRQQITGLWLALPLDGSWVRLPSTYSPIEGEPRWTITEDEEGRITVDPSIRTHWGSGENQKVWHGYLRGGVWETLPDSTGGGD